LVNYFLYFFVNSIKFLLFVAFNSINKLFTAFTYLIVGNNSTGYKDNNALFSFLGVAVFIAFIIIAKLF
jgi:hypothetical protein